MNETFNLSAPPVENVERPKRGPKKGSKRPRKASGNGELAAPLTNDHDILVAVVALGKLIKEYPPSMRVEIITALKEIFG